MIKFDKLPSNILSRIPAVREVLSLDQRVLFAYLFGGHSAGRIRPLSDVDIAVYLNNTDGDHPWEKAWLEGWQYINRRSFIPDMSKPSVLTCIWGIDI